MWTPLFMEAPEDENYPIAAEPATQILAEYLWLSGNGTQLRSQTRVVTPGMPLVEGQLPAEACPMTVVQDGVEVFLKPRKVFRDPFRGGAHILVMCDTFQVQGSDLDDTQKASFRPPATLVATSNNHRVHCAAVMEAAKSEQPLFSVEQEYELHQPTASHHPSKHHEASGFQMQASDSPQHSSSTTGGNIFFSPHEIALDGHTGQQQHWGGQAQHITHITVRPGSASENPPSSLSHQCASIFLSEAHQQHCLFAGIPVSSRQKGRNPSTWSYTLGPCGGVDLGDDLWASRYTLLRLAEQQQQRVDFDSLTQPACQPTDWGHTSLKPYQHTYFEPPLQLQSHTHQGPSCALRFSTMLSRHPSVGPLVLQRYLQKLRETHGQCGLAYGSAPQVPQPSACRSSFCGTADDSNQWLSPPSMPQLPCISQLNSGFNAAVALALSSGQLVDHRPAATMDPYLATMFLVSSTLDLAVPVGLQPSPHESALCDTASCQRQHNVMDGCCASRSSSTHLAEICRLADAAWLSAALTRRTELCPSVYPQGVGVGGIALDSAGHSSATAGSPCLNLSPQQAMEHNYPTPCVQSQQQQLANHSPYSVASVQFNKAGLLANSGRYSAGSMQFDAAAWDCDGLDAVDSERMDTYSSGDVSENDHASDGGVTYQAGSGGEDEEFGSEEEVGESVNCNIIPSEELLLDALDAMDGLSFTAQSLGGFLGAVRSDWAATRKGCGGFEAVRSRRGSCSGESGW